MESASVKIAHSDALLAAVDRFLTALERLEKVGRSSPTADISLLAVELTRAHDELKRLAKLIKEER